MRIDLVVGIPTLNESDSVANTVRIVDQGLQQYRRPNRCLIVNLDNDSEDDTKDVFLNTSTFCHKEYINTGGQPAGKGKNVLTLLKFADSLNAPYVLTVDADIATITPEWIVKLVEPLIARFDYTIPMVIPK